MAVQRGDVVWAAFFGLSPPAFLRPGIQVVAHQELADYHGVWLFRHPASLCLSVPPDLAEDIRAAVRTCTIESLFNQTGIRVLLGPRIERIIGPAARLHPAGDTSGLC